MAEAAETATEAAPEPQEKAVEIHKPKPFHSWREFLAEILVVVVGILIALSLEQVVEAMREAHQSAEARKAVRAEIETNLQILEWRKSEQACIDRRLDELGRALDPAKEGEPLPAIRWIGRPTTFPMFTFRLQAAAQSGRASLFSEKELAAYTQVYFPLSSYLEGGNAEQTSWAHLEGIVGLRRLTPETALNLRQALAEAKAENYRMKVTTMRATENAQRLGLRPRTDVPTQGRKLTCLPMDRDPPAAAQVWSVLPRDGL